MPVGASYDIIVRQKKRNLISGIGKVFRLCGIPFLIFKRMRRDIETIHNFSVGIVFGENSAISTPTKEMRRGDNHRNCGMMILLGLRCDL
jgi:hypothetical protein